MIPWRRLPPFVGVAVVALTVAGCGDDSVNPANPDASAAKDAEVGETGADGRPPGDAVAETGDAGTEGVAEAAPGDGGDEASD